MYKRKPVYHICKICEEQFTNYKLKRHSKICPNCYPKYRQIYSLWHAAYYRSKQQNKPFDLTLKWVYEQTKTNKCPKTGIDFTYTQNGKDYLKRKASAASIDKIDASLGYTQDNCQIVCWWYNVSKQQYTDLEVLELCQAVVTTYQKQDVQNVQK